jgi:hypothetical protein
MNVHCTYCNTALRKSTRLSYGMRCMCHDDHRFLNVEEVLLGFHQDIVYLLDDGSNTKVYDEQKTALQESLHNDR